MRISDYQLAPCNMALEFLNMDSQQQALFFNELAAMSTKFKLSIDSCILQITQGQTLTPEGFEVMELIGDHAKDRGSI